MKVLLLINFLSFFVFLVIAQKDQNETSIGSLCTKAKTEVNQELDTLCDLLNKRLKINIFSAHPLKNLKNISRAKNVSNLSFVCAANMRTNFL